MAKIVRAPVSGLESDLDFVPGEFYEHLPTGDIYLAVKPPEVDSRESPNGRRGNYYRYEKKFCSPYHASGLVHAATGTLRPVGYERTNDSAHRLDPLKASDFAPIAARVTVDPSPRRAPVELTAEFDEPPPVLDGAEAEGAVALSGKAVPAIPGKASRPALGRRKD